MRGTSLTNPVGVVLFASSSGRIDGTHHHVSVKHLHRYVAEFDFRYSTCKMSDYGRMRTLAHRMEGRLSYGRLIDSYYRYPYSEAS